MRKWRKTFFKDVLFFKRNKAYIETLSIVKKETRWNLKWKEAISVLEIHFIEEEIKLEIRLSISNKKSKQNLLQICVFFT